MHMMRQFLRDLYSCYYTGEQETVQQDDEEDYKFLNSIIFESRKLDFEIAVEQQTMARDRMFDGVSDSWCPLDSHAHICSIYGPILSNHINMLKSCFGVLYL